VALTRASFGNWKPAKSSVASFPVAASSTIYRGQMIVEINGYAKAGTDSSGAHLLGIAMDTVDNSAGDAGDLDVRVDIGPGLIKVLHSYETGFGTDEIVQANVGDAVFLVDDNTVDFTTSHSVRVGQISKIVETGDDGDAECWVRIKGLGVVS
jgi:hypothetical protein